MCTEGFPKALHPTLNFDEASGLPQYRRDEEADRYIVPHFHELLLHWNGHANVEYCMSIARAHLCQYIFTNTCSRDQLQTMQITQCRPAGTKSSPMFEEDTFRRWRPCGTSSDTIHIHHSIMQYKSYPSTRPKLIVRQRCRRRRMAAGSRKSISLDLTTTSMET